MSGRQIELYLVRHADAGDPESWRGSDDDRPLSAKGVRQSKRLGSFLAGAGFKPDAVVSSPKLRAHDTARLVADHLGVKVRDDPRLASGVTIETVEALLGDSGDEGRVVLVGHDPDFSELLMSLTGAPNVPMRKGAIARIDAERPLASGAATLRWLVPPDALPRETSAG